MDLLSLGYLGLFVSSFLAATLIPFASEGVLAALIIGGGDPLLSLLIATLGNSLGTATNYWIGMLAKPEQIREKIRNPARFDRFSQAIHKWGVWLSVLCWIPVFGDPLAIMLGFFRISFLPFIILVITSKFLRYLVVIYLVL